MKKIITLLLVLSLAGAMSTTALAAADGTPKSNSTNASSTNTVQITVKASGDGCIAATTDGSDIHDNEVTSLELDLNPDKESKIILKAKANDGYKFVGWKDEKYDAIFDERETISFYAEEDMNIAAVFEYNEDSEDVVIRCSKDGIGYIAFSNDGTAAFSK